jgi:methylmalonyl-CoA/ethylmalonyl-CoA epimerase
MKARLSHIAIACPKIEVIAEQLGVIGLAISEEHEVPSERVRVAMLPLVTSPSLRIELLEPTSGDSPVSKFLSKRTDGGLHHLSFEVTDLEKWDEELRRRNIQVLPPGIRQAARGRALFIHPKCMGGVLVELEEISTLPKER